MSIGNYDIVATLGPRSDTKSTWEKMASKGVNQFRLNTSHLSPSQFDTWLGNLSPYLTTTDQKLVLDLQGSKWRLGKFSPFELHEGQKVEFILAEKSEYPEVLPLPHPDFFRAASLALSKSTSQNDIAKNIILNDAKITLRMGSASSERVTAWVIVGGVITPRKGVTIPLSVNRQESLVEFDNYAIMATRNLHEARYAISYVKDAAEMAIYRSLLGQSAFLIAKLERQSALDDAAQIACYANELWLCRGDLGAELGMKNMAEQVHQFSSKIRQMPVPILMAGQVLEHMTENATPTRSEICFLYETLAQGFNGVVLSDETAIGKFPVETCAAAALFK